MKTLEFYKVDEPYGEFSNFAHFPVEIDGKIWPTTEHYFQAWKFMGVNEARVERLREDENPMSAALRGRNKSLPMRENWPRIKDDVMRVAVASKVLQHAGVRELLIGTGDTQIVEKALGDSYWGCGPHGTGRNMLGHILMEVRDRLQQSDPNAALEDYAREARERFPEVG